MLICRWNNTSTRVFDTLDPIINHYLHFLCLNYNPHFGYMNHYHHILFEHPHLQQWTEIRIPTSQLTPLSQAPVATLSAKPSTEGARKAQSVTELVAGLPRAAGFDGFHLGMGQTLWISIFEGTKHPFTSYFKGYLGYQDFDHLKWDHGNIMAIHQP